MKHQHSLKTKLKTLSPGESMVVFGKNGYVKLMRDIGAIKSKNVELKNISCKKATVIINDTLKIGVEVINVLG